MAISFYTQLKGIRMVALLTFATSQAFPVGSAGKAREAATGLIMAIWANIVRSIFSSNFTYLFIFNPFYKVSKFQKN